MKNNTYPTKDEVVYRKNLGLREYSYFNDMFYIKQVREGIEVLATKSHKECHYNVGSWYVNHDIDFHVNPVKGKTLDKNNKTICNGDVNVLNIFNPYSKLVFG